MEIEQPNHPVGQPNVENAADGYDRSVFSAPAPTFAEVLEARADRVAMVRGFLAAATPEDMSTVRRNPWGPEHPETTLSCLHTILREEWEHHRYAVRDLAAIAAGPGV
ncbi:MAG: DinB family protein [Arthrobacter sp.]